MYLQILFLLVSRKYVFNVYTRDHISSDIFGDQFGRHQSSNSISGLLWPEKEFIVVVFFIAEIESKPRESRDDKSKVSTGYIPKHFKERANDYFQKCPLRSNEPFQIPFCDDVT